MAESNASDIKNLALGANVSAGLFTASPTWSSRYGFNSTNLPLKQAWVNFSLNESGYFGFQFNTGSEEEVGHEDNFIRYGWARITWQSDGDIVLNEWAYDDSGFAIEVGAVPEPASAALGLGLLALGAAGMRRYKRKAA